jgi:hypothetical protein
MTGDGYGVTQSHPRCDPCYTLVSHCKDKANDNIDSKDDHANLEDGSDGELLVMAMDV